MPGAVGAVLAKRRKSASQEDDVQQVLDDLELAEEEARLAELAAVERQRLLHDGPSAKLVQHKYFEQFTLFVISLNALWIGVDLELNDASIWTEAHPVFAVADNFFCIFFSFEVCVRFLAFRSKLLFWKDKSFCFDSVLVFFMIIETWILAIVAAVNSGSGGGGLRQFSILRLLRLLRLTRMARLMRSLPELMTLMKGLVRALRSVGVTFLFLLGIMWVFSIIFNQQYRDAKGPLHDEFFKRVPLSMVTLFVNGTLLDEVTGVARLLLEDNALLFIAFLIFVLASSLTVLNMLIGVLTDVVSKTADEESRNSAMNEVKGVIKAVFDNSDTDGNAKISSEEFTGLLEQQDSPIRSALVELGISEDRLADVATQIFERRREEADAAEPDGACASEVVRSTSGTEGQQKKEAWSDDLRELSFLEFMEELIHLIPKGRGLSVLEVTNLRRAAARLAKDADEALGCAQRDLACLTEEFQSGRARAPEAPVPSERSSRKLSSVPTAMLLDELSSRMESRSQAVGG
eukprot:TRINITY_DN16978_c0_g1_i1.p1 TRINITY_DN16978_c0_g1~~TRINITY_DN16978_c0_g1_i1.p1  ORF type:complete len:519 (-),score=122.23 TRINITY_DN16978_c0_g1_i1:136-1692(-)